jgi:hypothetical protein
MIKYKLDDAIINELNSRKLWEYFYSHNAADDITQNKLIELSNNSYNIIIKDNRLYAIDDEGDLIEMPDDNFGADFCGKWFSDYLPQPSFDVIQSGNVRKAEEAECIYCALVVKATLNDENFDNDFNELCNSYDYDRMVGIGEINSFKQLLEEWQGYQSFIIKVAVSAAKYKLSDEKKDVSRFLQDGLMEEEVQGLQDLETNISSINNKYSGKEGPLSSINVKDLKKIRVLELLEERKEKIDAAINASPYGTLFKIFSLSSEYVSPLRKRYINKQVALELTQNMLIHMNQIMKRKVVSSQECVNALLN